MSKAIDKDVSMDIFQFIACKIFYLVCFVKDEDCMVWLW